MAALPLGTVTLLFTDIEGSTRLLRELGRERYVEALEQHRALLREAFGRHGGVEVEMQGDSFHFAFAYARDAVVAAAEGQRALARAEWSTSPLRVRIGLHTGEPVVSQDLYAGLDVHRAARVMGVASGGQVLLSARTADLVDGELPPGLAVRSLGSYALKDFERPEALSQIDIEGLDNDFPPVRAEVVTRPDQALTRPEGSGQGIRGLGRRRTLAAAGAAVVVIAGAAAAIASLSGSNGTTQARSNVVAVIDPAKNRVVKRSAVGNAPTGIAAGEGGVWVVNAGDATISELDPKSASVTRTSGTSGVPTDVAVGDGFVWIGDKPSTVLRLDPASGDVTGTTVFRTPGKAIQGVEFVWLDVVAGAVWATGYNTLARIDPGTLDTRESHFFDWGPVTLGAGSVWVAAEEQLYRLDGDGRHILRSLPLAQGDLVFIDGFLWLSEPSTSSVDQIDPRTNSVVRTISVGADPAGMAYGLGALWVASQSGTVARIDPVSARVTATIMVGGAPEGVAAGYGRVWVSVS